MKNKGIVIELTALLDVILIMLFWVMMNVREETATVREEADTKIAEYQLKSEEAQEELEEVRIRYEAELAEAKAAAEQKDPAVSAYQSALDKYSDGILITLNLNYDAVGKLFIFDKNGELGRTLIDSEETITDNLLDAIDKTGMDKDEIILCVFTYDGERALYRDIKRVTYAINEVSNTYRHFYCTYINTNR